MRTLYTMIISILIPVICYEYDVIYDIDLTLISIAIIFPLVFAIRGAFRRREKALEHLSKIRSSLMSIKFALMTNEKLTGDALIDAWEKATHNLCVCGEQDCPEEYSHTTHGY